MLQKDLAGMYPLCMIAGSSGQGKVQPQEDRVPGGHVALLRRKNAVFGVWLWRIVLLSGAEIRAAVDTTVTQIGYFKDSSESDACSVNSTDCKPLPFAT
ncbi:hypothetical protein AVEN_97023-1 [Araneus ventricosus]|uniref:Uncharacterized protein n=1 Tax=Araneus ventricosus TaxID=182803 RepID=A0A4Y2FFZ3_ARAVE|nr:hypothetical protein AVEN_97023-1 [Araneus ventricosus]